VVQFRYNFFRGELASGSLKPTNRLHVPAWCAKPWAVSSARKSPRFRQCVLLFASLLTACDKQLEVAVCDIAETAMPDGGLGDAGTSSSTGFVFPWSTGFESGFCGYARPAGFFYLRGTATYEIVTSPVHSGHFAAAYTTNSDPNALGTQARCVRQGTFPASAYYGAWFYIPSTRIESGIWNLMHISGNDSPSGPARGLWDVSLAQLDDGQLRVTVWNFIAQSSPNLSLAPAVPIDTWFHLEFYLKRASDATGEVALYQDDQMVLQLTGLVTDDSSWGQWYVGSYATGLSPAKTTMYVDDVSLNPDR
jgi:hypothetical protein